MTERDLVNFSELWRAAQEQYGRKPSPAAVTLAFSALQPFDLADISRALSAHITDPERGQYAPKPADVVGYLRPPQTDGHPGPEEAWAMLPKAEAESAVVTAEMMAGFGACRALLEAGDKIAARMAFKGAYEAALARAKTAGTGPRWVLTQGHDVASREPAIRAALAAGRLTHQAAAKYLPQLDDEASNPNGLAKLRLIKHGLLSKLDSTGRSDAA